MLDQPGGTYELRIYRDEQWEDDGPAEGADPQAVRVFEFLPPPEIDEGPPPPPPQVVRLDRGAAPATTDQVLSTLVRSTTAPVSSPTRPTSTA